MKKFLFKKQIKKVLLAIFLVVSFIFVSACSYSNTPSGPDDGTGGDGDGSYVGNISGFKLNYKPDFFSTNDFYYNFSSQILTTLGNVFGRANFDFDSNGEQIAGIDSLRETVVIGGTEQVEVIPFIYQDYLSYINSLPPEDVPAAINYKYFEKSKLVYFIDDIRNSVYLDQENQDITLQTYFAESDLAKHSWNWTHKIDVANNNTYGYNLSEGEIKRVGILFGSRLDYSPRLDEAFGNLRLSAIKEENINYYTNFYPETYAPALQVAILQMLLNKPTTNFAFDFNTNQVMPNPQTLLGDGTSQGLKYEYQKLAEYMGISTSDKEKITDYILEQVIGSEKYNSSDNYFTKADYEKLINELVWNGTLKEFYFSNESLELINDQTLGSIYDTYPTTNLMDFSSNKMFVSDDDKTAFAHLPKGEIRSVILMPSQIDYLYELWFYLAADRAFDVKLHYRYYDADTDTLFESKTGTVRTAVESNFKHEITDNVSMSFEDASGDEMLYKTTPFNNDIGDGILKASQEKTMNYELSKYFEPSSKGGYGLNHEMFKQDKSSFLEIVFQVPKPVGQENLDYSFKVGILNTLFAPEDFLD